jgi:hypothetical protein
MALLKWHEALMIAAVAADFGDIEARKAAQMRSFMIDQDASPVHLVSIAP